MTEETTVQAAPVEATAPEITTPKWSPDVETEARALGWKAPDEWKGEIPSGYIDDPSRYLERAENFTPFRKMREQVEEKFRKLEAVTAKQLERERAQHQEALAKVKADKMAAVEVGDVDAFKALEKREDALRQSAPEEPKQSGVPDEHRSAIERWSVDKAWFKSDPIKTQAAVILYGEASDKGLTDPAAILAYVDKGMASKFADMAPRAAVEAVEGGLTFGSGSVASPFEKLPKDAKDAFRRFVEKGVFKDTKEDRAQYAEDYNAA